MAVSESDRSKMRRIAGDMEAGESDDHGTAAQRADILAVINEGRSHDGRAPLVDRAPEEGLYDRAKSLGMARIDR